ncbi:MAG: rhomboid family intramembrane serine protease [Acidobacteriota bacterium]|nr:rhomboid family intramembrane serine protease [Blastocatellia bacterium]MDW8413190.1 rhomboid family intramembrane serine protease [Acidobacteriota bacterium]
MSYRYQFYNPLLQRPRMPIVKAIIIANIAAYLLMLVAKLSGYNRTFTFLLAMVPELITTKLYLWQFLTAMFLHGDIFHLLFNMLGVFFFGPELEWLWGKSRFLAFYFTVGITANVFAYLLDTHSTIPTIGASGAVLAIVGAYAALYPDREVILYIFPIKMKYLVIFVYLIPALLGTSGLEFGGNVAHAVHLAGLLMGIAYVKLRLRTLTLLHNRFREKLRIWKIRRKYRNFRVVDEDVKRLWDELEDQINKDKHIN